jgi:small subunit ribosomal protein S4e
MTKRHLKTINAPKTWPVERKNKFWITRTNPGPHSLDSSLPLSVVFGEILEYTASAREVRRILNQGKILVNGRIRKEYKFPLGIFDVLEFPEKEHYRLLFNKRGKLSLNKIEDKEKDIFLFKITGKKILKNKFQFNFSNGENILSEDKKIKTGDTVIIEGKKIKETFKLEKGAVIYLTGGKHVGTHGKVENIEENHITFSKEKENHETLKKYAFVVGKGTPLVKLNG